ncbi:hypothetical protein V1498_15440 [Peribacillus sp. SCS-26]|uniref:hypothetical protein n=1 Tax=Paraperibacillus marinus TaxID=3115295 RepID=UPI003906AF25
MLVTRPMGLVDVDGYDKADKENELNVTINVGDDYDVMGVGYTKDIRPINESK